MMGLTVWCAAHTAVSYVGVTAGGPERGDINTAFLTDIFLFHKENLQRCGTLFIA